MDSIERYYRDKYPAPMREMVARILPEGERALATLYELVVNAVSASYGRVPDVKAVRACLGELHETPPMIDSNALQIEDAGAVPYELQQEWWDALNEATANGEHPWESERLRDVNRRIGVPDDAVRSNGD